MKIQTLTTKLAGAFYVLDRICRANGQTLRSVTIDPRKSDLPNGKVVGLVTVGNRSRKPFKVEQKGRKTELTFLGTKLAA